MSGGGVGGGSTCRRAHFPLLAIYKENLFRDLDFEWALPSG